ncbi:methyltransferase domain-containing protein [Panacibacter ginsenosidivorans]|uniref:Methyltransferase domain-containing protein n=1 Tax=Panacibacter ginsenosidivorans TaxID=1813871 RepID=A0A5B8VEA9_9BACT|nr:1-acyl-sn-glycerol-3-phosphate acyltransferase [Panacibacter ginsenosidivorans]QEC69760.1 methyltransferase domain-containing protein [Panacibacter ginsenosidivorans]
MEKFFLRIYNYFSNHKTALYVSFVASFLVIGFFASRVVFEEDISRILPNDKKIEKLNSVFQNSKFADKLAITISLKDSLAGPQPDSLVNFTDSFVSQIQNNLSPFIAKLNYKVDDNTALELFSTINDHLPVFLTEKEYATIDSLIKPETVKQTLESDFRTLISPSGFALKQMISKDPVGISFIGLRKIRQLQYDDNFELYDSYIVTKDQKHLLIFITPAFPANNTGKNAELIHGLDNIIDSFTSISYKNISVDYFGAAAVSLGNAEQLRNDTLLTQGITVIFLILFIGFYFKKKRAPFLILIPVVFGALFSLAAIYFIKGTISVIALGTGSVILGIAINYSLHVFNHYRHTHSSEKTIEDLSFPLTIGSFTTIGGFLCLEFVQSELLKDLGLFAAFSLIGAALCSLIYLPHFIHTKEEDNHGAHDLSFIDKLAAYNPHYNKILIAAIIALTIFFSFYVSNVGFDSDMMHMNYMSDNLKKSESNLNALNQAALKSVYAVSEGNTLDEALKNSEHLSSTIDSLKQQNIVTKYSGVSSLILSDSLQRERINRWNNYWTVEKKQALMATLKKEGAPLKFSSSAFNNFNNLLNTKYEPISLTEMTDVRKKFLDDYISETPTGVNVVTLIKVSDKNKPAVYKSFAHNNTVTVLDKQYLADRMAEIINTDFTSIAYMSSILVFIVLLITYGRIELALVSFIPMFITWIWILGIMSLFNIQFNIINIIISALIFGLGDDYSLFIMDGLLQEYKTGKKNLSSFKSSIFLSAITTVAGLGVLIFAKHPALKSIAFISITGILCVVLIAQVMIPFLFNFLITNRVKKNKFPWTALGLFKSFFSFAYFVIGSILLTIAGFFLVIIFPFGKERGKLIYHTLLSKYTWSLVYIMSNLTKRIVNPHEENFKTPAVIICNHQSFLDILVTTMLYPKLILLTNQWVWKSPVFGWVIRMADYYPVADGIENSIELLEDRVKNGYSIVIFPEGTRTVDGAMKRFHKGAFYLAEKLNLDILPVIIHGTGYTMTKHDFLLKDGTITLTIEERIKPGATKFGDDYTTKAKTISKNFKQRFAEISNNIQQPAYYKEQLKYNYLYKGPVLEWYMRIKTKLEKYYQPIHNLIPGSGKMLDIGCGYGFMSYMLHFAAPQRIITGIDYDDEKITLANHCFSKDENINFLHADATNFETGDYDVIIMADMLHYLESAQQKELIEKCIRHLNPGGTILIRDGNTDLKERHKKTKLTEFFSTRLIGFNKTSGKGLTFFSGQLVKDIAAAHNMQCKEVDNTKYTSNIIYLLQHAE